LPEREDPTFHIQSLVKWFSNPLSGTEPVTAMETTPKKNEQR